MYGLLGWDNIWPRYVTTNVNVNLLENLRVQKKLNIEKIAFKVVQMKIFAMHIANQKWSFHIFMVGIY